MSIDDSSEKTPEVSREATGGRFRSILRGAALVAVVTGAVGSIALMLRAGERNHSHFLLALFAVWTLSPFVGLVLAQAVSKRWPVVMRATLYGVMLVLPVVSVTIYGHVFTKPPASKAGFLYLVVPLGSWAVMAIVLPMAAYVSGKR